MVNYINSKQGELRTMKKYFIFLMIAIILVVPAASGAAPLNQGQDYVVQADDWLSKLSDKFLVNRHILQDNFYNWYLRRGHLGFFLTTT